MKKQVIAIAILSAAVCLTGCTININDETITAAKDIATSVLDETEIKVNGQPVDISVDSNGDVGVSLTNAAAAQPGADLFGGYVVGDTVVKAKPDTASETLITIPDATQINVRESGESGWFMTEFKEQTGYIAAKSVKEIQPYDPALGGENVLGGYIAADSAFVKLMSGTHSYAEALTEIPNGTQINYYVVPNDAAWCVVNYQEHVGYVESRYIAEIESYEAGIGSVPAIVGEWRYQLQDMQLADVYDDAGYVTVDADGTYIYQPKDGSLRKRGTVKVAYEEHPDGSQTAYYAFTENESGEFWIGTSSCDPTGKGAFYIGNGRTARLFPKEPRFDDFSDYVGRWQCDRCTIQIGEQGTGYLVTVRWADSASEDNEWTYQCSGMSDNTGLECKSGGTLTHIVTAADGTETRTTVYNDGDATFRYKGGRLFWSDGKENKGMEMGFEKIG